MNRLARGEVGAGVQAIAPNPIDARILSAPASSLEDCPDVMFAIDK